MNYDADKTPKILEELRDSARAGDFKTAIQLLRHADAGGKMRADPSVLNSLRDAVGEKQASAIVRALAADACRYCSAGRENCEECGGNGYVLKGKVCSECSGLGVIRCPFCNGTALAGYDFVPRGLRPAVVAQRLATAERRLSELTTTGRPNGASELARRMIEIDRCRGILANAVEQVRIHSESTPGGRPVFSPAARVRTEQRCRQANGEAEAAIRSLLSALAKVYADKVQRASKDDERRILYAHRAKTFARLSNADRFDSSAFETPQSLRRRAAS